MKKITEGHIIIGIVSLLLTLVLSDFKIIEQSTIYSLPILLILPIVFVFLWINWVYIKFSYQPKKRVFQKIIFAVLNMFIVFVLFFGGFEIWKATNGNISLINVGKQEEFRMNFKNVLFWVLYQSLSIIYVFSVLKILVSNPKK